MTTRELQAALQYIIGTVIDARQDSGDGDGDDLTDLADEAEGFAVVGTFEDHGLLTSDAGLVLTMEDGSEFQLTIVQRR